MCSPFFLKAMLPKSKIGGAVTQNLFKSFCFGGGGFDEVKDGGGWLPKADGEGAALRSNAEEGADYRKVVGKGDF